MAGTARSSRGSASTPSCLVSTSSYQTEVEASSAEAVMEEAVAEGASQLSRSAQLVCICAAHCMTWSLCQAELMHSVQWWLGQRRWRSRWLAIATACQASRRGAPKAAGWSYICRGFADPGFLSRRTKMMAGDESST